MYFRIFFLLVDFLLDWYSICWKFVILYRVMCKDMVFKKRIWDFLINGREKKKMRVEYVNFLLNGYKFFIICIRGFFFL